jgi:hypothetical protein
MFPDIQRYPFSLHRSECISASTSERRDIFDSVHRIYIVFSGLLRRTTENVIRPADIPIVTIPMTEFGNSDTRR